MKEFKVKTESELKNSVNKEKKKSLLNKIGDYFVITLLVLAIIFSGSLLFIKIRYVACFVSGMSMFPTLNTTGYTSDGSLFNPENGSESTVDGSTVDFLLADEKDGFREKINRFDIVCSYYESDYNSSGLKTYASEKIKRVIGMPNETIWLVTSPLAEERYTGSLYVCKDSNLTAELASLGPTNAALTQYNITKIEQPLNCDDYDLGVANYKNNSNAKYNNGNTVSYNYCWTLKDNEYILLGDNRMHSHDSRSEDIIKGEYLTGLVISYIGKAKITDNGNNASFKFLTFNWRDL